MDPTIAFLLGVSVGQIISQIASKGLINTRDLKSLEDFFRGKKARRPNPRRPNKTHRD